MALKTFTVVLALAGIAASVYASRRRSRPGASTARSAMEGAATMPSAAVSPNAVQRQQQEKLAGQADTGWAAGSEGGDLATSSSPQGERPAGTGIPDFTRGA